MLNVVSVQTMRDFDRCMINDVGIDGMLLMETAARAAAESVIKHEGRCVVLIGPGNNGGDGIALIRILKLLGREATGLLLCDPAKFRGDALKNYQIAVKCGLPFTDETDCIKNADIIVDAVFGTGLSKSIEGKARQAIEIANSSDAYRIAVDIPSGINGDTGEIMGIAFNADETVTFQCIKRGLLLTKEREKIGKLITAPIAVPPEKYAETLEREQLIDFDFVNGLLPERKIVSNKGSYGKALLIVGSAGMTGAAIMCANACLRAGAGLTKVFAEEQTLNALSAVPEIMTVRDITDGSENGNKNKTRNGNEDCEISDALYNALEWADAVGIGCGTGNDKNIYKKLIAALKTGKPTVIDADGLNCMDEYAKSLLNENCIITPHPGEMARLIKKDTAYVLSDPVGIAERFANKYGCVVLLKSAVTVIAKPEKGSQSRIRYNTSGNTGLAKGGSGDTLTGIITALLAQKLEPFDAASCGAYLLGTSAEEAYKLLKTRLLTASDAADALALLIH